jgi:hypothetical protein
MVEKCEVYFCYILGKTSEGSLFLSIAEVNFNSLV